MELSVNGRNMEVTTRLRNYVEKKTVKLDRYMPNLAEIHVDLSETNARNAIERQVAQITIRDNRGTILRAEERSNDMFASVDAVVDKLYRQISRYRGKKQRKWRGGNGGEEPIVGEPLPMDEELVESDEPSIVRTKRFTMRPMTAEEAVDQLELLGHDFFVFFNADEQAVNVLYRRRDNNFGLLQPDMD
ncbi:MAG: ribosome-associated translation inhibitor RaiA [Ardenticatenaceae bacterium]|nr:ribosome-associated translation inhibitor RaiA [Anaerolineales bacterium]MCB8938211.1 ribosome-associated translation inhibitor RaiA [Ardenticatenaceae bacterium]MCB8975765.1 ribosome-associated translation inhibitor RaiA [Ardenticatenaceae bacterium]